MVLSDSLRDFFFLSDTIFIRFGTKIYNTLKLCRWVQIVHPYCRSVFDFLFAQIRLRFVIVALPGLFSYLFFHITEAFNSTSEYLNGFLNIDHYFEYWLIHFIQKSFS